MKKARTRKTTQASDDDLKAEYKFDYSKAKPNRFASREANATVAVVLDPDVAKVFKDSNSVNSVLRALVQTMPRVTKRAS